MDFTTIPGILAGLIALLAGFLLEKGNMASLLQLSAIIIVFGGTIGAVVASFPLVELRKSPKWFRIAFTDHDLAPSAIYQILINSAEKARREGLLSLEQDLISVSDKFTQLGLQLVVDGTDPETIVEILDSHIDAVTKRHKVGVAVFEAAGGFAPTMGIIGTVMGLIQVLGHITDPTALSGSIASAFTATLYGVASANLIWLPIATKLKMKDKQECAMMEMVTQGIVSIQSGENPSILREKLRVHIVNIPEATTEE